MRRGRMKKRILVVTSAVAIPLLITLYLIHIHHQNQADEIELVNLYGQLQAGLSHTEVEGIFLDIASERLNLIKLGNDKWLVTTPHQFGATNWNLWIDFLSKKNSAHYHSHNIRIRLADSVEIHPRRAPQDKKYSQGQP
jgi:hypothetical protein